MGNLVSIDEARFHIAKDSVSAALIAMQRFVLDKPRSARAFLLSPPGVTSATSLVRAFRAAGFKAKVRAGAIIGLDFIVDKLRSDTEWTDVKAFFESIASFVRRGSFVRFSEIADRIVVHEFKFAGNKVTLRSKAAPRRKRKPTAFGRAWKLYDEGKFDAALEMLGTPRDALSWNLRGLCYHTLGRHDEGLAAYQRAVKLSPDDATYLTNIAQVLFESDRYEEAIAMCKRVIALDAMPDAKVHFIFCNAAHCLDRHEQALREGRTASELDPTIEDVHLIMAISAYGLARYREAKLLFEEAAARRRDALTLLSLADTLVELHEPKLATKLNREALRIVERDLEADGSDAQLWSFKASALFDLGKPREALVAAERALEIDPTYANARRHAARSMLALARPADALAQLQQVTDADPKDSDAWFVTAETLFRLGRKVPARRALQRAVRHSPHLARRGKGMERRVKPLAQASVTRPSIGTARRH